MSTNGRVQRCIGILREVKNKWERRVPLTPQHVAVLVQRGIDVLVQPSERRIFSDDEYAQVGAVITDDLRPATTIFGVKEFPANNLIPGRNYVLFSHVIKGQAENMPFLDECFRRHIRLFDYECITDDDRKRLVAFGKYAGNAGMIDGLRAVGERFLSLGFSTPFMGVSSSYMYPSLEAACAAVAHAGNEIARVGLPRTWSPFTFAFTGSGNVAKGAMDVFQLLPHEFVSAEDLRRLKYGEEIGDRHKVYGCKVATSELVQPLSPDACFSRKNYYDTPEDFTPVFHRSIAPYANVLVNGIYWDLRFPRLLTRDQLREIFDQAHNAGHLHPNLMVIADISCDINGSIEFVERSSTIDQPFYRFDPVHDCVFDDSDGRGVLMMAVDNLPAEFPREASSHFSTALLPFVEALSCSPATQDFPDEFPSALSGACITSMGQLRPKFSYIHELRVSSDSSDSMSAAASAADSATLEISGHLFDTGLINQVFDVIEFHKGNFRVLHVDVAPNTSAGVRSSHLVLQVAPNQAASDADGGKNELNTLVQALETLIAAVPSAQANMRPVPGEKFTATPLKKSPVVVTAEALPLNAKKILVLGSGFVAEPLLEYLSETQRYRLTVASDDFPQAQAIADRYERVDAMLLSAGDRDSLKRAIHESDAVVSLLPAFMHADVAKQCIASGVDLVTASYVSDEMASLHEAAQEAGVILMNEVGLDPGLDHMSAMRVIDEVHGKGGRVHRFESFCGGLPAPEAADNFFRYKFSWSPIGVLKAAQNAAVFKKEGQVVHIAGDQLLASSQPLHMSPVLRLEHVPNRDCLPYGDAYGISDADTLYRGTIRYTGFCELMQSIKSLGLLRHDNGDEFLQAMLSAGRDEPEIHQQLRSVGVSEHAANRCVEALRWLELTSSSASGGSNLPSHGAVVDQFCQRLLSKLRYREYERDLVLMHHIFGVEWPDKRCETRCSSLYCYGEPGGFSAMAKTVGLTAAIVTQLIVDGRISGAGVHKPMRREVYEPVLQEVARRGIIFVEGKVRC